MQYHMFSHMNNGTVLTHWRRVTHICVDNLTIIGSDNGLSPGRRQAIIWTNVGMLLIGILGTNFSEIFIEIYAFSFKKMHLKRSSAKRRSVCLGVDLLTHWGLVTTHVMPNQSTQQVSDQPLNDCHFSSKWIYTSCVFSSKWSFLYTIWLRCIWSQHWRCWLPGALTHWPLGDLTVVSN